MLEITFRTPFEPKQPIFLGVFEESVLTPATKKWDEKLAGGLLQAIKGSHFEGKIGQSLNLIMPIGTEFRRIILIGLGKKDDTNEAALQKIGGFIAAALAGIKDTETFIEMGGVGNISEECTAVNIAIGLQLRSWKLTKYKTKKEAGKSKKLNKVSILVSRQEAAQTLYEQDSRILKGVFLARELVSEPANILYPKALSERASELKKLGVKIEILGDKELTKLGMGALLGVGQGSIRESQVVVLSWQGTNKSEAPLAFLGKGVTFDTGGISIKPAGGMEEMKFDMAGAAAVIGLMHTLAARKAKVNAVGIIGLVENMPSGTAQRPGDVVTSLSGQTIEVINTDAEGRLVLSDILWYAQTQFKPRLIVDLATLTGAIIICLGSERAGLFANDDQLAEQLLSAGKSVDELLWRLPLDEAYDKELESDIADVKNVASGRGAGSIIAAKFLERFIKDTPWAHLDIAGVAWANKDLPLCGKGATAFGVRLLDRMVRDYYEK